MGKTRIVIEVLRQLSFEEKFKDMIVAAVDPSLETGKRPIIGKRFWGKWPVVVLFFDDLERYLGAFDLVDFVANFYNVAKRVIVVATCHKEVFNAICEKPEFTRFFSKEDILELCEYSNDEGKCIAAGLNKPFPEDFTGTVDQLVLDTPRKRQIYEEKLDDHERAILKSAKLLRTCRISAYSAQLLKAVWKQIFDGKGDWDGYFSKIVESYSLLRMLSSSGVEKYSIADAYLDDKKGVVCGYPSCKTEIVDDARFLKEILFEMKAIDELFAVGYFFVNQCLYEDALAYFECVLKLNSNSHEAWLNKGVALGELGRYEEALADFNKAIELNPDNYDAWVGKGVALGKLGRHQEALTAYNKATELNPKNYEAWLKTGVAFVELGHYLAALIPLAQALTLNPNNYDAWLNKGLALCGIENYGEALTAFNKAIELNPNNHDSWFNKGLTLWKLGRHEEALTAFNKVTELNPNNHDAWHKKGAALAMLGRYEEALTAYNKAIELNPNYHSAWQGKGLALGKLGRYEEALADFNKAIKLNPDNYETWFNKGVVLEKLGRYEEALTAYNKVMELHSDIMSLAKVAQLLLILGDYKKGLNMAEKAFAISKTTEEKALSCLIKVSAYYLLNKIKEAEEEKSIMINLSTQGEKIKTPWDFSELLLAIEKLDNEKKKAILDFISYFTQK
ncbi:MAG: tetratricopeptide repeat protein [Candidatus Bathyarchaeia archaeon]